MAVHKPSHLVPRLRFPEFRSGQVWKQISLSKAFKTITNGKANAEDHQADGAYPLFDRSDVVKRSPEFLFDAKAVILPGEGMKFTPRCFNGKFNLHQRAYALMEPTIDWQFAFHALDRFKGALADSAVKSTVLSLRMPIIEKFVIPCPKSDYEQRKIADCLGSLDELIAAEDRKLEVLQQHKQGLMQQLFPQSGETVPRLRFSEFQGGGDWGAENLGSVCKLYQPMTLSTSELKQDGPYLVYGANGIIGCHDSYNHENSQVIVTCRGATCGEVTRTQPKSWITGNAMVVKSKGDRITDDFIFHSLRSSDLQSVVSGSAQPQITRAGFAPFLLVFPRSKEEQKKISDCFGSLDDLIAAESWKLDALRQHKQGLMQQLFPSLDR